MFRRGDESSDSSDIEEVEESEYYSEEEQKQEVEEYGDEGWRSDEITPKSSAKNKKSGQNQSQTKRA